MRATRAYGERRTRPPLPVPPSVTPVAPPGRLAGAPRHAAARLAYVAVIAAATLRDLALDPDRGAALARLARAVTVTGIAGGDVIDGVRNVALFAGFGVVWIATARPTRLGTRLLHATVLGVALSVSVELVQCFSPVRRASVLDVATNGVGALAGAAVMAAAVHLAARLRARAAGAPGRTAIALPLLLVAAPYLAACWLEAFSPFGALDRVPGAWGGLATRWAAAVRWLAQTGSGPMSPWDLVLFGAGGVLGAAALLARRWSATAAVVVIAAFAVVALPGAEALRGLSGGELRPATLALRVAALVAGALAATLLAARDHEADDPAPSAPHADARALAAYLAVVALWSLRPLDLVAPAALGARLAGIAWVPLSAQYGVFGIHSVADLAIAFLLWLPVGAWLAARTARALADAPSARLGRVDASGSLGPRWRALGAGLALAVGVEALQLVVRGRTVDSTDALVQGAGVLVGWSLLRRADARAAAWRAAPFDQSALGYVSGGSSPSRQAGVRSSGSTARVTS